MTPRPICIDGNEAAARVAYKLSEVIAIYPITPASPMGELSDAWMAEDVANLWGAVPEVVEMQSEAGAAGTVHGALQAGALATTFTASQGLLLMLPNMFKIAGELTPCVIHVAARTLATHALSIFGDHSDVMAARTTGFAMLASSSVQEAQDLALVAHVASLRSRVPFLHFFDGFRTSHQVDKMVPIDDEAIRAVVAQADVEAHRARRLTPDAPVIRGTAQNPDVFFQAREAITPFYADVPATVRATMRRLEEVTGRSYDVVRYHGHPDATKVIVTMGSSAQTVATAVDELVRRGRRVGMIDVKLYRPFPTEDFMRVLPESVDAIAVLDRTKEPGAVGEPLYQDVATTLTEADRRVPTLIGGRYGLSSKEFTPAMVNAIFAELEAPAPRRHFTVGINDDVSHSSLEVDTSFRIDDASVRAVFYGLGSDGTVGANKSSVKIVGEHTDLDAQGYFVYDSKKSGSMTVSHLRFDREPIAAPYLIEEATFVACHQTNLLDRVNPLAIAADGATFLLNSPSEPEDVWDSLPSSVRKTIADKRISVHVINAHKLARELGLGAHINMIMQACFFHLAGVLDEDAAFDAMRAEVAKAYGKRGEDVVSKNLAAIDRASENLYELDVPDDPIADEIATLFPGTEDFVDRVTRRIIAGEGELLPVSALPVDGTFPTATARFEKRRIAQEIPEWDPSICIDCGHCTIVCPHAALRMKVYDPGFLDDAPEQFRTKDFHAKEVKGMSLTIQVAPEDCTGCTLCVDVCPVKSKTEPGLKAINMVAAAAAIEPEKESFEYFLGIPDLDRDLLDPSTVKGSQVRRPLFEFPGACAGCGETPYLKLLTQLFGDKLMIANATGCSSIYGANLPTTPWAVDDDGHGPAWANSLFEDNAEFGYGMRVALDQRGETDKSVWIIGGDGWAYDIGYSGLDHILASGRNVNVLVLDTEVYSNTGGQASKATPRGAVAKFASRGKGQAKKDLGMIAASYGGVYVAQIALGANYTQTIKALQEAEAWDGPSLVIAYSTCIAHGIEMGTSMTHQKDAVRSGYWPLYRYHPGHAEHEHPFHLDSKAPSIPVSDFTAEETRFSMLARKSPDEATRLADLTQDDVDERWRLYEQLASVERTSPNGASEDKSV